MNVYLTQLIALFLIGRVWMINKLSVDITRVWFFAINVVKALFVTGDNEAPTLPPD